MKNSIIIVSALALLAIGTGCSSEKMAQINKKHIPSTYVQNPMPTEEGLAPVAEGPDEGQPSTASAAWGDNFLVGY